MASRIPYPKSQAGNSNNQRSQQAPRSSMQLPSSYDDGGHGAGRGLQLPGAYFDTTAASNNIGSVYSAAPVKYNTTSNNNQAPQTAIERMAAKDAAAIAKRKAANAAIFAPQVINRPQKVQPKKNGFKKPALPKVSPSTTPGATRERSLTPLGSASQSETDGEDHKARQKAMFAQWEKNKLSDDELAQIYEETRRAKRGGKKNKNKRKLGTFTVEWEESANVRDWEAPYNPKKGKMHHVWKKEENSFERKTAHKAFKKCLMNVKHRAVAKKIGASESVTKDDTEVTSDVIMKGDTQAASDTVMNDATQVPRDTVMKDVTQADDRATTTSTTIQAQTTYEAAPIHYATPATNAHDNSDSPIPAKKPRFGARMLEKMGHQKGQGLGREGTGILTPLMQKVDNSFKNTAQKNKGSYNYNDNRRAPPTIGRIVGGKLAKGQQAADERGKYGKLSRILVLRGALDGLHFSRDDEKLMDSLGHFASEAISLAHSVQRIKIHWDTKATSIPVFVEYYSEMNALNAVQRLEEHNVFKGNKVVAKFYPDEKYDKGMLDE